MLEIIVQNIENFSFENIIKFYGSNIRFFNNNIEVYSFSEIHKREFFIAKSCDEDMAFSFYFDEFNPQYMSDFEYLSDENIFNLDIKKISHQWNLMNLSRIHINSENMTDIYEDKKFLKVVLALALAVDGYINVTEFIPNIKSGLHSTNEWASYF